MIPSQLWRFGTGSNASELDGGRGSSGFQPQAHEDGVDNAVSPRWQRRSRAAGKLPVKTDS